MGESNVYIQWLNIQDDDWLLKFTPVLTGGGKLMAIRS